MLFSSIIIYRIIVTELSRYGHLHRPIIFLLCKHENMSWSCDLRRYLRFHGLVKFCFQVYVSGWLSVWLELVMKEDVHEGTIIDLQINYHMYELYWLWEEVILGCGNLGLWKLPVLIVSTINDFWWHVSLWENVIVVGKFGLLFLGLFEIWIWQYLQATERCAW
jgi:hypothetical protein